MRRVGGWLNQLTLQCLGIKAACLGQQNLRKAIVKLCLKHLHVYTCLNQRC